jgi:hypothetical protein
MVATAVVERAPADSMFSTSIRRAGVELLREFGYIEAEKAAAIVIEDTNDNRKAKAVDEFGKPDGYQPSKTFKKIESVSASPARLTMADNTATLKVVAGDPANQDRLFTWRKLEGPGNAAFTPNGTADAAECQVVLDAAGKYLLEVTLSDPHGLSEASQTLTLTVEN